MGRSYPVAIVIEVKMNHGTMTPLHWKRPEMGEPCAVNLTKVVEKYNEAFAPGGCNHDPETPDLEIVAADLVLIAGHEVLATYRPAGDDAEGFAAFHVEGI